MARSQRDSKLDTRAARLRLKVGQRYYLQTAQGVALGYRRTTDGFGNWQVRVMMPDTCYDFRALGRADDYLDANGDDVLNFFQAQQKAREAAEAMLNPALVAARAQKPLTVADAAKSYLTWYKDHRQAFRTTEHTVTAHILPTFGDTLLSALTTTSIRAWHHMLAMQAPRRRTRLGARQNIGEKPTTDPAKRARKSTANRILTVLKAILNRAFENELVADDAPWRRVKPFANADEPITRFLTTAESVTLINACHIDFRPLVKAALFTGARYGELTGLLVADVNLDTEAVYIRPGKSGKGRNIPLSHEGLIFFRETIEGRPRDAVAFTKSDGSAWGKNHHVRLLRDACHNASIVPAIGFHELRHTYASLLAQAGVDLLTISKLLGHADTRITSRHYAHLADKTLANAVRMHLPSFGHTATKRIATKR